MKFAKIINEEKVEGYKTFIVITRMGFLNGYVAIPKDNALYEKHYNNIDLDVHGGLTYSDTGLKTILKTKDWILGFDCGHAGDGVNLGLAFHHLAEVGDKLEDMDDISIPGKIWKNQEYVQKQLENMVDQIIELNR